MKRLAFALALLLLHGCIPVSKDTRVEKGPVLSSEERTVEAPGNRGVVAKIAVHWPTLTLGFRTFRPCRNERVETFAEDHITERAAPAAGPAFAMGLVTAVLGGGIWLWSRGASDVPDRRFIDASGHYGPSARQQGTLWGVGLMVVGLPALGAGILGLSRSGEEVRTEKVTSVISAIDAPCVEGPKDGEVELLSADSAETIKGGTQGGAFTVSAEAARALGQASLTLDGAPVQLGQEENDDLQHYLECTRVVPATNPEAQDADTLRALMAAAKNCEDLAGPQARTAAEAYGRALATRTEEKPSRAVEAGDGGI